MWPLPGLNSLLGLCLRADGVKLRHRGPATPPQGSPPVQSPQLVNPAPPPGEGAPKGPIKARPSSKPQKEQKSGRALWGLREALEGLAVARSEAEGEFFAIQNGSEIP